MKKLMLTAALCVAALVVVPVSSASAAFTGTCVVKGTANFGETTLGPTPKLVKYTFAGKATECAGEGTKPKVVNVTAGEVYASCVGPLLKPGHQLLPLVFGENVKDGKVEVDAVAAGFLDIEGSAGGVVAVKVYGNEANEGLPQSTGTAEFFTSLGAGELAAECALKEVNKLEFVAALAGKIS